LRPWRLAFAARPQGAAALAGEVTAWAQAGITHVVSLLEPAEAWELQLDEEAHWCAHTGIAFTSFPVPDRGVPASVDEALVCAEDVSDRLRDGATVLVHCRLGIGRSALFAGLVMLQAGVAAPEIFPSLSRARGRRVPDTREQFEWLFRVAAGAIS
jgi:protein-tyrosine phosphatase